MKRLLLLHLLVVLSACGARGPRFQYPPYPAPEALAHLERAEEALGFGALPAAADHYAAAVGRYPELDWVYVPLAEIWMLQGDPLAAVRLISRVGEHADHLGDRWGVLPLIGDMRLYYLDVLGAKREWRRAARLALGRGPPEAAAVLSRVALVDALLGDHTAVELTLDEMSELLGKHHPWVWWTRAVCYAIAGRLEEAAWYRETTPHQAIVQRIYFPAHLPHVATAVIRIHQDDSAAFEHYLEIVTAEEPAIGLFLKALRAESHDVRGRPFAAGWVRAEVMRESEPRYVGPPSGPHGQQTNFSFWTALARLVASVRDRSGEPLLIEW